MSAERWDASRSWVADAQLPMNDYTKVLKCSSCCSGMVVAQPEELVQKRKEGGGNNGQAVSGASTSLRLC